MAALTESYEVIDMHNAITKLAGHVTAQLAAGVCLARLCVAENATIKDGQPEARQGFFKGCYIKTAVASGTFGLVADCMAEAVLVSFLCTREGSCKGFAIQHG